MIFIALVNQRSLKSVKGEILHSADAVKFYRSFTSIGNVIFTILNDANVSQCIGIVSVYSGYLCTKFWFYLILRDAEKMDFFLLNFFSIVRRINKQKLHKLRFNE